MRTVFVGGNWKCNGTAAAAAQLAHDVAVGLAAVPADRCEVLVAPPLLHVARAQDGLQRAGALLGARVRVAAQNCVEKDGAYTGEHSAAMLRDAGVAWVVLGHSERRTYYGESDAIVGAKVAAATRAGLAVVACVGESLEERDSGRTLDVVRAQVDAIAAALAAPERWADVVLAYEPKWAIGTGRTASPEQAEEVHAAVRAHVAAGPGEAVAAAVHIIYGGSVNRANAAALIRMPNIDGFLVGGASLDATHFVDICRLAADGSSPL
jgi:triosephosphate isomerase